MLIYYSTVVFRGMLKLALTHRCKTLARYEFKARTLEQVTPITEKGKLWLKVKTKQSFPYLIGLDHVLKVWQEPVFVPTYTGDTFRLGTRIH